MWGKSIKREQKVRYWTRTGYRWNNKPQVWVFTQGEHTVNLYVEDRASIPDFKILRKANIYKIWGRLADGSVGEIMKVELIGKTTKEEVEEILTLISLSM